MLKFTDRENHTYQIEKSLTGGHNTLMIQKDNTKHFYKVVDDFEYTYKIQKTQIKAQGGSNGLYKHFQDCIEHDFAIVCWVINPINQIFQTVKEVKL